MSFIVIGLWDLWKRWERYIESLQRKWDRGSALVPYEQKPQYGKKFQEDQFAYNLGDREPHLTNNDAVNAWILDFAKLNIDIFHLIRAEHTLPDEVFLKKRYLQVAKQVHPDKGGTTTRTIEVNHAYQMLHEHLYRQVNDQVALFNA